MWSNSVQLDGVKHRLPVCMIQTWKCVCTLGKGQQAQSPCVDLQQVFPSAQATESLQGTERTARQKHYQWHVRLKQSHYIYNGSFEIWDTASWDRIIMSDMPQIQLTKIRPRRPIQSENCIKYQPGLNDPFSPLLCGTTAPITAAGILVPMVVSPWDDTQVPWDRSHCVPAGQQWMWSKQQTAWKKIK